MHLFIIGLTIYECILLHAKFQGSFIGKFYNIFFLLFEKSFLCSQNSLQSIFIILDKMCADINVFIFFSNM